MAKKKNNNQKNEAMNVEPNDPKAPPIEEVDEKELEKGVQGHAPGDYDARVSGKEDLEKAAAENNEQALKNERDAEKEAQGRMNEYDKLYASTNVRPGNNPMVHPDWKDDVEVQPLDPKRPPIDNDPYRRYDGVDMGTRRRGIYASRYGAMAEMEDYDHRYANTNVRPGNNPMYYQPEEAAEAGYSMSEYDRLYANTNVRPGNNPMVHPDWKDDVEVQPLDPKRPPVDSDPYRRYDTPERGPRRRGIYASRYGAMAEMDDYDYAMSRSDRYMREEAARHARRRKDMERSPYSTYQDDYEGGDEYLRAMRRSERNRYMPPAGYQDEYAGNAYERYYGEDPREDSRQRGREQYREARANWEAFGNQAQAKWQAFSGKAQDKWQDVSAKASDTWGAFKEKADEAANPYKMNIEDGSGDEVVVDKNAIAQLTKQAVQSIDGIIDLDGGFMGQFAQNFDYDNTAGVSVSGKEKPILDVKVILEYGAPGPKVLRQLRERLKEDLEKTLDLTLDAVHVEVTNVMTAEEYQAREEEKASYRY